jgi:ABC-2 type transport system permease protein
VAELALDVAELQLVVGDPRLISGALFKYMPFRPPEVQALIDGSDASVATVAQSYIGQIAGRFGARVSSGRTETAGVELRARAWYNPSLETRLFNVPAIMGTLLLMTNLMLTSICLVRKREIGTLDQLLVSPISPAETMIGKLIPVLAVGLFHLVIFVGLALLHFGVPFRGAATTLALAAILFLLAALGIGLLISAVSKTQQEAFMLMVLTMLPAIILSGLPSPVEAIPPALRWLTYANPIRYFLEILRGLFLKGSGLAELWPQFLAVTATVAVVFPLATNRFRRSLA